MCTQEMADGIIRRGTGRDHQCAVWSGQGIDLRFDGCLWELTTQVAITDYPAAPIIDTLKANVAKNVPETLRSHVTVEGHMWGSTVTPFETAHAHGYTRIVAADCLWMPGEHENLAKSMLHFLSDSPDARVLCIAGFHTGRAKVAPFFEEVIAEQGLAVEEVYEMKADGERRAWAKERDNGREDIGERKKWLVVARLKRR
jgi:hypothetical protein